jgi:hypothetical protein
MLSKGDKILDIDYAVAPGHRANVAKRIVCAPLIYHDAHIGTVNNSVAVEVNDWSN